MPSSVRLSVCLSSVVCNARAPYSGDSNFRQYFYGVWYLGRPLTCTKHFTEIVPGEPLRRAPEGFPCDDLGREELNTRGVAKYSDFGPIEGSKFVLIANRKSHMSFRLVPKSATLNDLERHNGRYFSLFQRIP